MVGFGQGLSGAFPRSPESPVTKPQISQLTGSGTLALQANLFP